MSTTSRWTRSPRQGGSGLSADRVLHTPTPIGAAGSREIIDAVTVTWQLARTAAGTLAPPGKARMLVMTVQVESLADAAPRVTVELTDAPSGQRARLHDRVSAGGEVIPDIRGQVHVEIPGWLHATIGPGPDGTGWRLVYARTPVLEQLGVPGGRAEPIGVAVVPA